MLALDWYLSIYILLIHSHNRKNKSNNNLIEYKLF